MSKMEEVLNDASVKVYLEKSNDFKAQKMISSLGIEVGFVLMNRCTNMTIKKVSSGIFCYIMSNV